MLNELRDATRRSATTDTLEVSADDLEPAPGTGGVHPSTPPPLPLQVPHHDPIEALGVGFPVAEIGMPARVASIPPIAMDAPPEDHHRSGGTLAFMIAVAGIGMTPLFLGSATHDAAPPYPMARAGILRPVGETASAKGNRADPSTVALACDEVSSLVPEQFIELDAVQVTPPASAATVTAFEARRPAPPPRAPMTAAPKRASFDAVAAARVIHTAGAELSACAAPATGPVNVAVTFAPSGGVTVATVEAGPLRGTREGSCIAERLRGVRAPAFDGPRETVRTELALH